MTGSWRLQSVGLTFSLGEVRVFRIRLPMMVFRGHFTELDSDPDSTVIPWRRFSSSTQGAVVRSHPVKEKLPRISWLRRAIRYVPSQYNHYYIDLRGSFDDYLRSRSSRSRSTLKRKVRRFAKASGGQISWREFREPREILEFHRLAREVSAKTYQERLLNAGLPDDERFKEGMLNVARRSMVRGYVLFYEGRPISYLYCPTARDGILLYDYVGYDPEHRGLSPGTVLMYLALKTLFADHDVDMFDFEEGEGQHKETFANAQVHCANIYYFRPTFRNLCIVFTHTAFHYVSRTVAGLLEYLRLKARIKRVLRAR